MNSVRKTAEPLMAIVAQLDDWHTLSLMTLFVLARYSSFGEQVQAIYSCLLAIAIVFRRVVNEQTFWFVVLFAAALPMVNNWWAEGGHAYLLLYWLCAIFLSFSAQDQRGMLSTSGRHLIGATFLFAALWKFMSPEFSDGTALRYFISTTIPIGVTTQTLTGLNQEQLNYNIQIITSVLDLDSFLKANLIKPPRVEYIAGILTLLTKFIESFLAFIFIIPLPKRIIHAREIALIFFFVTAYIILPVPSFAVLLACIGFSISSMPITKTFFLLAFFFWQIITLPFGG